MNKKDAIDEIIHHSRLIQKPCFARNDELWNSGNRGSEHNSPRPIASIRTSGRPSLWLVRTTMSARS